MGSAIAVGELRGPAAALDLVEGLELAAYYPFHATRAELLRRLHRQEEAVSAYETAASLASTEVERSFLSRQGLLLPRP